MILTNNKNFYDKLKIIRNHGIVKKPEKSKWYYEIEHPSFNYRITDIQCALGQSQLKKLNRFIKRRREIVARYNKAFENVKEIIAPAEEDYVRSSWHIYPIQVQGVNRKKIFEGLQKMGIGVQVHYMPLHMHPFYRNKFGYKKGDFPIAERYYKRAISLPLYPKMTNEDVRYVIKTTKNIISHQLKTHE